VNAQVGVCPVVGQQQMREKEWGINTRPQNLALLCRIGTLGTSDPRSVLPRGAKKLNNEALSVLLTQGRYYRGFG
jgi:hypothetical protein